ncbi:carboxylesterase/lipase family protein [Kibdelosporangium phytohabitans]|uniref:Carboxylesterase n=1 Tax=Kibdelosporangium phytohabitans TaxID=860235 RepID=A0A0N9HVP5_9PSEU|nr:carboxylesterase family protein [Kibdelosporangium phytohabitans]ALG07074.1 carboxylesterase [Kibdelosporangium phytohabitans]MBE1468378.1 para-nitrobenzyl esterase [Kibdelosporangium phytohabitans]
MGEAATDITVDTRDGAVRGTAANGVMAFKGIPYAAPPVGPNRFQPPRPVEPWTGVRDATRFGPTAPKAQYLPPLNALIPDADIPGDDYLNLNVYTPGPGDNLPVMVWIHGGAFLNGSGSSYDGTAFARDGVVCVTLNYRLGADGFLYYPGNANRGLLDQITALEWVRDNIAAFGGDPGQVTAFGESAGAMSVAMLLGMPRAAGLFRRAILQSGAAEHVLSPASAELVKARLVDKLGTDDIAAVPVAGLVAAQQELRAAIAANPDPALWGDAARTMLPFGPVADDGLVPGSSDVDIMIGTNADEFRLYIVPHGLLDAVTGELFTGAVLRAGIDPAEAAVVYQGTPGEKLATMMTDWHFRTPAIRLAQQVKTAYMYEFAWQAPTFDGKLGACHAAEIPFVFDTTHDSSFAGLLGTDLPQHLADTMHQAWVSFATNGNPGWFRYDTGNRSTMRFDIDSEVVLDPHAARRALWDHS